MLIASAPQGWGDGLPRHVHLPSTGQTRVGAGGIGGGAQKTCPTKPTTTGSYRMVCSSVLGKLVQMLGGARWLMCPPPHDPCPPAKHEQRRLLFWMVRRRVCRKLADGVWRDMDDRDCSDAVPAHGYPNRRYGDVLEEGHPIPTGVLVLPRGMVERAWRTGADNNWVGDASSRKSCSGENSSAMAAPYAMGTRLRHVLRCLLGRQTYSDIECGRKRMQRDAIAYWYGESEAP